MNKKEAAFIRTVKEFYKNEGRHALLWRKTHSPYRILVSEVMLQQTQVDRVLPKYRAFIKMFPTVAALAKAPLGQVLRQWQGLGYNRRAKLLHECAEHVLSKHKGIFPRKYEDLLLLPGVGPYTASAVCAFAFNEPIVLIETNVRSVYLHHFFKDSSDVNDKELLPIISRTLDAEHPREWYWALMDYGSHLKKMHGNPNTRSSHYTKQSAFKGSDRQLRGRIIRLLAEAPQTRARLLKANEQFEDIRVDAQLSRLLGEGMIVQRNAKYALP
jgi:A/G-specific adenine glycosylase